MKLGYIDYLNCFPIYYHILKKAALHDVSIFPGRPNVLNKKMSDGTLDMSPISAATCAEISDKILLLPDFCLSSVGYVGSVVLISKIPIDQLDGKKVALTNASHTSVVLLKTLIKKYYNTDPFYMTGEVVPDANQAEAVLLIGNEAMEYEPQPGYLVYDLGALWLEKTGYPVVFAAFAVRKEIARRFSEEIRSATISFYRSLACLTTDKPGLIAYAKKQYPDIDYDLDAYYDYLKFYFTDELKAALDFYCRSATELGFLDMPSPFEFLNLQ